MDKNKGSKCSINGKKYEEKVYEIVKKCKLNNKIFNTQDKSELGGSSNRNDIECNYKNDIGIEIKKYNSPDWMQCSIKFDDKSNKWITSEKNKIPNECKDLFQKLINNIQLYDGEFPPFVKNKLLYINWLNIKKNNKKWNDVYLDISNDIIKKMYSLKDCKYIQISEYGLYHLGEDICQFGVPEFITEQQIRIRIKVHTKKNKEGYCVLSVMASCKPKNIKILQKSNYSLDNEDKLPENLKIIQ